MPTYEYRCAKCGERLEVFQSFTRRRRSPSTRAAAASSTKVLSPAGIVLKGSGFYKTDNRASSKRRVARRSGRRSRRLERSSSDSSSSELELEELRLGVRLGRVARSRATSESSGSRLVVGLEEARGQERLSRGDRRAGRRRRLRRVGLLHASSTTPKRSRSTTPFGAPSASGHHRRRSATDAVAFIPRHGRDHEHAPAARSGARQPLGDAHARRPPRSSGRARPARSQPDVHPGDFVVLDQLVDRTWGRPDTFYDAGDAHHVSFADPYCPVVGAARGRRRRSASACRCTTRGTVVVIQGPRFSTRAESRWYRAQGWDVVNMTQYPEAYLARELGMHYAGIALVTDYDTGVEHDPGVAPVTQEQVFAFFEENLHRVRALLLDLVDAPAPTEWSCDCASAIGPLAPYETA